MTLTAQMQHRTGDQNFRFFLRGETRGAHEALDALVGPIETLDGYRRFLRGLYRYRSAVEGGLRAVRWPEAFGTWRPLHIEDLLAADLADLDEAVRPSEPGFLSNDMATLLGVSYVLEGSALGARVIYRQARALGLSDRHGARHLAAQAAELTNWTAFLEMAESVAGLDRQAVAKAANDSFADAAAAMRLPAR